MKEIEEEVRKYIYNNVVAEYYKDDIIINFSYTDNNVNINVALSGWGTSGNINVGFSTLLKLHDFYHTDEIDVNNDGRTGCKTCGYRSLEEVEFNITNVGKLKK